MISRRSILAVPALAFARPAAAQELRLHGSEITLVVEGEAPEALRSMIPRWITKSAGAVALYYGKFPVPLLGMGLSFIDGAGIRGGQAFPGEPPFIRARAGRESTEDHLMQADWVMVHEMIHLAFPYLDGRHRWMHEGLAVYVESIARVQAGHLLPGQIWGDFVRQMPKGLPRKGAGGYDQDESWGRTYWGGALFCLLCDIEIRKRTGNTKGLQTALRAINAERDFRKEWPFRETLELGDRATGERVLIEFYDRMRESEEAPDLEALWAELGVALSGKTVAFDDGAPLAAIRAAIARPMI